MTPCSIVSTNYCCPQASEILSALESKELTRRPAFVATQAAFLEASDQGDAALELVTRVQEAELADRQKTKPEKAIISKGVLPIIARLQLKVGSLCLPLLFCVYCSL